MFGDATSQTISPATTNDFLYSSRKKSSPSVETPSQLLWLSLVKDVNTPRKPGPISATNEILENRRQLRNIPGLIFFPSLKIGFSLISLTLWSAKLVHGKPAGAASSFHPCNYTSFTYTGPFSLSKDPRFLFFPFPESRHLPCAKDRNQ